MTLWFQLILASEYQGCHHGPVETIKFLLFKEVIQCKYIVSFIIKILILLLYECQEWDDSASCESDTLAKLSFDHDDDKLMRGQ